MAGQQQKDKKIGFKTIILFKDQTLGIGAYGAVCKAKCDDLTCAAKIIHPTLFSPTALHQIAPHRQHRLPIRRFQQECEFLSTIRHPNIVQYLGTHQDSDTGLPVLLMELVDGSLTHFLETSTQQIPYHIQVNICCDITLALSFLHSNDIIHRDLSSNNVLLIGNIKAKLTDFGMARLGDLSHHKTNTMCPGTAVYMPPEAVQDKPVYTEKIDCFSFGVITVQTLTQEFPKPGDRMKILDDPRFPRGALKLTVPEMERRQNHISQIDPNHPLLQVALDCLKDNDDERPSAQQLCKRVAALKETAKYKNACEGLKDSSGKEEYKQLQCVVNQKDAAIVKKEEQLKQCRTELMQQIQKLQKDKDQVIQEVKGEKDQVIQEKERQLEQVNQKLEESERLIAAFSKKNMELEELLSVLRSKVQEQDGGDLVKSIEGANIQITWRKEGKSPCTMGRYCDAVVDNNMVYCTYYNYEKSKKIYGYDIPSTSWSPVSDCPTNDGFALTITDGLLTAVGGFGDDNKDTNKLFSLTGEGSGGRWTEKFPPMPTKRFCVSALCTTTAIIVAGGSYGDNQKLKRVEVLNTETQQWHTAPDLPEPLSESSITLCGDLVYLLGGVDKVNVDTSSVYSCSLGTLLFSAGSKSLGGRLKGSFSRSKSSDIWNKVADLPVTCSTAVSLYDHLLAIGGRNLDKCTTAVHMYKPTTDSWEVVSHMSVPRSFCLAAFFPDNRLMVVGGWTTKNKLCDLVEFGNVV